MMTTRWMRIVEPRREQPCTKPLSWPKMRPPDYQQRHMLAVLRGPVDAFFEAVMVNDEVKKIRHNRLSLLQRLVNRMRRLADFDLVE